MSTLNFLGSQPRFLMKQYLKWVAMLLNHPYLDEMV